MFLPKEGSIIAIIFISMLEGSGCLCYSSYLIAALSRTSFLLNYTTMDLINLTDMYQQGIVCAGSQLDAK
jgi:hypothetical protein